MSFSIAEDEEITALLKNSEKNISRVVEKM
jgi:hypothetical protein